MQTRVKVCAIAKNEGAYLAGWVFHHLHFGFDGIEVMVNQSSDGSAEILEAIGAVHPQVGFKVADALLEDSLARGKSFQYRAYARMARRAVEQGYTHAAFLDLDEHWTPRDLATPIGAFIPEDPAVNVVAFPWCVDVPDAGRPPFTHALDHPPRVQRDPHVKSVVRLDDRVRQLRTHTARTTSGTRLHVREPFPLVDEVAQQWGSVVPAEWLAQRWHALPEAFVLHAVHRSPIEYVSTLARGRRQTGTDLPLKTNRPGFLPSGAPQLAWEPDPARLASYAAARAQFLERVGVAGLVAEAERAVEQRGEALLAAVADDADLLERLRIPLRGIPAPALDGRHPGWDARLRLHVDGLETAAGRELVGWAFGDPGAGIELAVRDASGRDWTDLPWTAVARPDVVAAHPAAHLDCGFRLRLPSRLSLAGAVLLARPAGAPFWDEWPLPLPAEASSG